MAVIFPISATREKKSEIIRASTSLPVCGLVAQLVEHCTGIRGGHGLESRRSPDIFRLLSNCLMGENLLSLSFFTLIYSRSSIYMTRAWGK